MKISKLFLLIGVLLGIILALVFIALLWKIPTQLDNRYYSNARFNYIIPQPGDEQISRLEALSFIERIIPYYNYSCELNGYNINLYLLDSPDCSQTVFGDGFLLQGRDDLSSNSIIVDKALSEKLGWKLGDSVVLNIEGTLFTFYVTGVSELNRFSPIASAAVLFDGVFADFILSFFDKISYSGAFVSVNDKIQADNFFANDYVPEGKIGKVEWYASEEMFRYVQESVSSISSAHEIIDVEGLILNEKSEILLCNENAFSYVLTVSVSISLFCFLLWCLLLFSFRAIIVKDIQMGIDFSKLFRLIYLSELLSFLLPFICGIIIVVYKGFNKCISLFLLLMFCYLMTFLFSKFFFFEKIMNKRKKSLSDKGSVSESDCSLKEETNLDG